MNLLAARKGRKSASRGGGVLGDSVYSGRRRQTERWFDVEDYDELMYQACVKPMLEMIEKNGRRRNGLERHR